MEKLGAVDANFLYTETESVLNHIASVQRLRLAAGTDITTFISEVKQQLMTRLHQIPYLTRKLVEVPGQLDHPFWVRDTAFNIDNHIHQVHLPEPGTFAQFERAVAQLHAIPMDRSKPMWAIKVITGFQDGTIAYYNQVHHACLDGISGQTAIMNMMDTTPVPRTEVLPDNFFDEDINAGLKDMLLQSVENLIKFQLEATNRSLNGAESALRMAKRATTPGLKFGAYADAAPRTHFNRAIAKSRTYAAGEYSLTDVKTLGKLLNCKVNDVFMNIVAGGFRRYLMRQGALPLAGLIAACPVSLRQPGDTRQGNQVTLMRVNLATEFADPRIRQMAIRDSSNVAKQVTADLAGGLDLEISLPCLPAAIRSASHMYEASKAANTMLPAFNVVISNIPGPRDVLYSNGAKVLTHYPVSIPVHGAGINITVQSYVDKLYFAITACAEALPDAQLLRDDMHRAFTELRDLVIPSNIAPLKRKASEMVVEGEQVKSRVSMASRASKTAGLSTAFHESKAEPHKVA
ncbi:MAG: diacylglycerol O-acyltransferase [Urechidicola sp.]|jgi:diacylglycerol O-acyltransferase